MKADEQAPLFDRTKAIACLSAISRSAQSELDSAEFCSRTIANLQAAMRHPERGALAIELDGTLYGNAPDPADAARQITATIDVAGSKRGRLLIGDAGDTPMQDPDAQALIDAVAGIASAWLERRSNQARLHLQDEILANVHDLVAFVDTDFIYRFVNRAYAETFTTEISAIVGKPVAAILGRSMFLSAIKEHLEQCFSGQFVQSQIPIMTLKGQRVFDTRYTPRSDGHGKISGAVITTRDITDLATAIERLERSESHFRDIADNVPGAILRYVSRADGSDRLDYISPGCRQVWEIDKDLIGDDPAPLWAMIHPDDVTAMRASVMASQQQLKAWEHEWRILPPSGHQRWLHGKGVPRREEDGSTYWNTLIIDVSEQRRAEDLLDRFFNQPASLNLIATRDGRILRVNSAWQTALGWKSDEQKGFSFIALVHPDDRQLTLAALADLAGGHPARVFENRYRNAAGHYHWLSWAVSASSVDGLVFASATDITEQRDAKRRLKEAEARHRALFDHSPVSLWEEDFSEIKAYLATKLNGDGKDLAAFFDRHPEEVMRCAEKVRIISVNERTVEMFGADSQPQLLSRLSEVLSDESTKVFRNELVALYSGATTFRAEARQQALGGKPLETLVSVAIAPGHEQDWARVFVAVEDISDRKAQESELARIAHQDALTGLPNRRLLTDRLTQAIALADRSGAALAICYLDLDGFKPLNDRHGHAVGVQFLVKIGQSLQRMVRAHDSVARFGGDEFVLLLTQLQHPNEFARLVDRILAGISRPIRVDDVTHQVTASIGVTLYPSDNADPDTLLRHADQAMYRAKESGRNLYQLYDPSPDLRIQEHQQLRAQLRHALHHDELTLHYQPQVDFVTRAVIGVEALVRWNHPTRGLLPPAEFLPEIIGGTLDVEFGTWVIDSALKQLAAWNRNGLGLRVGVNISGSELMAPGFTRRLRELLSHYPEIAPSDLELEILESTAFSDFDQARRILTDCHATGVRIALDDFGTGYSSLVYFRSLPIDLLKIDQSFVRDMLHDPGDMEIVESVVRLSQAFDREVIAEGVETLEHASLLQSLDCRLGQGYGIAKPMPAEALPSWMADWAKQPAWLTAKETWGHHDLQLVVAAQSYLHWIDRIAQVIEGTSLNADEDIAIGDTAFARWYRGRGAKRYGQHASYQSIGTLHDRSQDLAASLLGLIADDQLQIAKERLNELYALRAELLTALGDLVRNRPDESSPDTPAPRTPHRFAKR
jgi:diguanylate cyclase (GGDEF)-like protein/PAS domain S-box-containing protein